MRKLTFTFTAFAVALALSSCKSVQGPSIVVKEDPVEITKSENKSTVTTVSIVDPKEIEPIVLPKIEFNSKSVNTDKAGKVWRVLALNPNDGKYVDGSNNRRAEGIDFNISENSPFKYSSNNKESNSYLVLDLGTNSKNIVQLKPLENDSVLGAHHAAYTDTKIEGNTQTIEYLYVNQPNSSYGAVFTNQNEGSLFQVYLTAGKSGTGLGEEGSSNHAEYEVFTTTGKYPVWKDALLGEATYTGKVIAQIERQGENGTIFEKPKFDGDVKLTLNLSNNKWDENSFKGNINSTTIGKITLDNSSLFSAANNKGSFSLAEALRADISISGEAHSDNLSGDYTVHLTGPQLNEAVGSLELENDSADTNEISKYKAVFGATK